MRDLTRRQFMLLAGGAAAALASPIPLVNAKKHGPRVIVVGGGFGGSTCAKYLKKFDATLDVTLIEPVKQYVTCPFSNAVIGGMRNIASITHSYDAQRARGVKVIHEWVRVIDPINRKLRLASGKTLHYDKLVVSPGIDFRWDKIEGHSAKQAVTIPHAWQAGAQTKLLRRQLVKMRDGGTVLIAPPGNPYRCPPGPYERASLIAHYLKKHKPKSKIIILDSKEKFSKQPLFMQGWASLYPGMIEWVPASKGGHITRIDAAKRTLYSEMGDAFKGDVINLIPPQKAAAIAFEAGLVDNTGWCPVEQSSFESSQHKHIHVLGDASSAGMMPKSGFAASSHAKVTAAAIVSEFNGNPMPEPSYVNTCYSLVAPDYAVSVAAVYRYDKQRGIYKVKGSGGASPRSVEPIYRRKEAEYAYGWYDSITGDTFG